MIVSESVISKVRIEGVGRLDPIDLVMEDIAPHKGKVIIRCGDESWTGSWTGMPGDDDISAFMKTAPAEYLVDRLCNHKPDIKDYRPLTGILREHVCKRRRLRVLDKAVARDLYDKANFPMLHEDVPNAALIESCVDSYCWWNFIPDQPNPEYQHMSDVIHAVQAGLRRLGK